MKGPKRKRFKVGPLPKEGRCQPSKGQVRGVAGDNGISKNIVKELSGPDTLRGE